MKKITILYLVLIIVSIKSISLFAYSSIPDNYFITINKSNNILTLSKNGKVINYYSVATGAKPSYTPEGKFKIVSKVKNPSWGGGGYAKPVAGGAPDNPLGKYWMGLSIGGGSVYGIHGTNNESSIGKYVSHGCIRMHNKDVKTVYNTVSTGTHVWIGTTKLLNSYGLKNSLIGNKNSISNYKKNIVKINGIKMKEPGYIVNGDTHIHWKVLDLIGLEYKNSGNGKFEIESRKITGKKINGDFYINWGYLNPGKIVPKEIKGGFNFITSKYKKNIVKVNGKKMKESGYIVNGDTHIHWKVLDLIGLEYKNSGNGKFEIESRKITSKKINGDFYINWGYLNPGKIVPKEIKGGFDFITS